MRNNQGFTLIETIIFIVIVGIAVLSVIFLYMVNASHSHEPLIRQKAVAVASAYMDEILGKRWDESTPMGGGCVITPDGNCGAVWSATTTYTPGATVVPSSPNSHKYEAVTTGTSSAAEPIWAIDGSSFSDGTVTWLDLGDQTSTSDCGITPSNCGPDGENRDKFDDIDDFNGLSNSPPQYPDQSAADGDSVMPGYDNYTATVTVTAEAWNGIPADDVRRIEVTVTTPMGESISLIAYRLNI
jgi:type II secretory pathway pseudopilin PulG